MRHDRIKGVCYVVTRVSSCKLPLSQPPGDPAAHPRSPPEVMQQFQAGGSVLCLPKAIPAPPPHGSRPALGLLSATRTAAIALQRLAWSGVWQECHLPNHPIITFYVICMNDQACSIPFEIKGRLKTRF